MSDLSSSLDIPAHFKRQFATQWQHVCQQKTRKFASAGILIPDWTTKQYIWQDLDTVTGVETTGQRGGDTNVQEMTGGARTAMKRTFDIGVIKHKWDQEWLHKQALPESEVIMAMDATLNRWTDDVFIDAATTTVYGGADPYVTAITLPATSQVAVNWAKPGASAANVGLTPWKILEAKRRIIATDEDMTGKEFFLAISSEEVLQLTAYSETYPNETWAKVVGKWIEQSNSGLPAQLMGCTVIHSERLPVNTSTDIRTCALFLKEGFHVSGLDHGITVDRLPTKRNSVQFLDQSAFGALRVKDPFVQVIYCDRSP